MKLTKKDYFHYLKVKAQTQEPFEHFGSTVYVRGVSCVCEWPGRTEYKFQLSCGSTICMTINKGEKE